MPSLGADMDVGTVLEWLVKPGAEVHRGDIVAVVDTAKAAVEVEVFDDGVVEELLVPVGQQVAVGTPLAVLAPLGTPRATEPEPRPEPIPRPPPEPIPVPVPPEPVPEPVPAPVPPPPPPMPVPPSPVPTPTPPLLVPVASPLVRHLAHERGLDLASVTGTGRDGTVTRADVLRSAARRRSSPYARRRAAELGVDLTRVTGTGLGGVVRAADVESGVAAESKVAVEPASAAGRPTDRQPADRQQADRQQAMRAAIAALMARSKREVPHYYLTTTVDLDVATRWLRERNRSLSPAERLLPAALLLKAVATACRDVAGINGFWRESAFVPADAVHLGVAVALRGGGLVTPAIHDAEALPLDELMARLRDLVARTRAGRLRRAELTDGTLTVTNLGDLGVESVHGVIYPPQVALVGFGKVMDRPVAVDGLLGIRPTVTMTLAADHRASDGMVGARYLGAVDRLLQRPEELAGGRDEP